MASLDRIINLASQRRALQEAADERRLKACLHADAQRAEQIARNVAATTTLRALGEAVEHGVAQTRATVYPQDKSALRPHPSDEGRKPLMTNWPSEDRKVYKRNQRSV